MKRDDKPASTLVQALLIYVDILLRLGEVISDNCANQPHNFGTCGNLANHPIYPFSAFHFFPVMKIRIAVHHGISMTISHASQLSHAIPSLLLLNVIAAYCNTNFVIIVHRPRVMGKKTSHSFPQHDAVFFRQDF